MSFENLSVQAVAFRDLSGGMPRTSSEVMRQQVKESRRAQAARFNGGPTRYNADMSHRQTRQLGNVPDDRPRLQAQRACTR